MNQFRINDVNGIADLTITLDGPGVYVARGPNGAGKSSAIEALKAANGDANAKAEPSDGEDKGSVLGSDGVVFSVGHRRRMNGLPSVRLISTGAIGQLIDPQIKDEKTAAKARLKALLLLMPLPADDAARKELTANDEELQKWIMGDPATDAMDLGESVRKRANELANELEKFAAQMDGEEQSMIRLIGELGTLDFNAGEYREARATADAAVRDAEVKAHTARARASLEEQQGQIRGTLGPRPDSGPMVLEIQRLAEEISGLERRLAELRMNYQAAIRDRARADQMARVWDAQAEILKRVPEGPTFEEARAAVELAAAAQSRAERARTVEVAKEYQGKANEAKKLGSRAADRAAQLRGIAKETATALGRLLERRGLPGLVIVEGRLGVKVAGRKPTTLGGEEGETIKDFDTRLSFGQRVRAALGIALAGMGEVPGEKRMPILPLEPGFWLALDDVHKKEIGDIAKERGVCLVTEEPDGGDLRVEKREA